MAEEQGKYENNESEELTAFGSSRGFEQAQRMAKMLASSQLVPSQYQNKTADCVIALEMAQRIGASAFAVLQNMYIVHGKPAFSAQFLISCFNASGRFTPIRYKMTGEQGKETCGCIAWATDQNGETLEGPEVTINMAKAEGWYDKNGSKWKTMPGLMLRYRAATLFVRLYAPEITHGMLTDHEVIDITPGVTEHPAPQNETQDKTAELQEKLGRDKSSGDENASNSGELFDESTKQERDTSQDAFPDA